MRSILVVRHCEPDMGGTRICLGRVGDPPLSAAGREHARELAGRLSGRAFDGIYASPLARSRQTAACFGGYHVVDDLIEQDYGEWDGLEWPLIKERYPDLYARRALDNGLVPPGAETCAEAAARYERALLAAQGDDCLVVVHKGALCALLCRLMGVPFSRLWDLDVPYGGCWHLIERDGRLEVRL